MASGAEDGVTQCWGHKQRLGSTTRAPEPPAHQGEATRPLLHPPGPVGRRGLPNSTGTPPPGQRPFRLGQGAGAPQSGSRKACYRKAFHSQISPLIATQPRVPESQCWFLMKTRCSRLSARCPGPMSFAFVSSPCTRTLRLSPAACRGVRAILRGWNSRDGIQHPVPSSLRSRSP